MLNLEPINELHRQIQAVLKRDNMIKPNELRIGNLVGHQDSDYTSDESEIHFTGRIESIDERYVIVSELGLRGTVNYDDLIPIPLSDEWMERLGFKAQEGYDFPTFEDQYGNRISLDGGVWKYWLGGIYQDWAEIRFLHRLQNFYFEYTNRELEVKL